MINLSKGNEGDATYKPWLGPYSQKNNENKQTKNRSMKKVNYFFNGMNIKSSRKIKYGVITLLPC